MNVAGTRAPAVSIFKARPAPRLRVFCLPYAGAGASAFRLWDREFPDHVELISLQPPGRERRISEPLSGSVPDIVAMLATDIADLLDLPFAFFGHSMGALLAFEAARELRRRNLPGPVHVVASGMRAPQTPRRTRELHGLPDEQLVAELRRLGGTPDQVFAEPELLALVLPALRADLTACETYDYRPEPPLACPISAWRGTTDREVNDDELAAWRRETAAGFSMRRFAGGHLYPVTAMPVVTAALVATLARYPEDSG